MRPHHKLYKKNIDISNSSSLTSCSLRQIKHYLDKCTASQVQPGSVFLGEEPTTRTKRTCISHIFKIQQRKSQGKKKYAKTDVCDSGRTEVASHTLSGKFCDPRRYLRAPCLLHYLKGRALLKGCLGDERLAPGCVTPNKTKRHSAQISPCFSQNLSLL